MSKSKPSQLIKEARDSGQSTFGENYVQELVDKAGEVEGVEWHFIGPLQSNKARQLLSVSSLAMLETVDREKIADRVDSLCEEMDHPNRPLPVLVQVNTSGEESKSGVEPGEEAVSLARHVHANCANLSFRGLMTIGHPQLEEAPTCFDKLVETRKEVASDLNLKESSLELSMGMSQDWGIALSKGATSIRIGSAIFGQR